MIAPRFGDIFRGNALQRGLLAVAPPMESVEALWDLVERTPGIVSSTIRGSPLQVPAVHLRELDGLSGTNSARETCLRA